MAKATKRGLKDLSFKLSPVRKIESGSLFDYLMSADDTAAVQLNGVAVDFCVCAGIENVDFSGQASGLAGFTAESTVSV